MCHMSHVKCRLINKKCLKANKLQKDKLEIIQQEDCTRKLYIEKTILSETRVLFQYRTRMTKNARNYKGRGEYRNEEAMRKFCIKFDSNSHLMKCFSFSHLK